MDMLRPSNAEGVKDCLTKAAADGKRISVYSPEVQADYRLDLSGLDAILEIDAANLVAVVQPGVRLQALAVALAGHGLRFVPGQSPFLGAMTVGEFYATGAPNLYGQKYGPAKHLLLGSTVVLGNGDTLKTGGRTVKNVTGYDLTRFVNAPFAALGVTVEFNLKLLPSAEARFEGVAAFDDAESAIVFAQTLIQEGLVPAQLLWVDPKTRLLAGDDSQGDEHLVLFEFDGTVEEVGQQEHAMLALLGRSGGGVLADGRQAAVRAALPDLFALANGLAVYGEYSIKAGRLQKAVDSVLAWAKNSRTELGVFGQVAEGKLALRLRGSASDNADVVRAVSEHVEKRGGFVSGRFKRLLGCAPEGELGRMELMMKKRFDPSGVLAG